MIKQNIYEDIKITAQREMELTSRINTIKTHYKSLTTTKNILKITPPQWGAQKARHVPFCVLVILAKVFVSLCFRSDCRGHVVGLTPRFEVRSQVLSAVQAQLTPNRPQAPPLLFKHCLNQNNNTQKNVVE